MTDTGLPRIRLFGSDDCKKCKALIADLEKNNVLYTFVDAFADETQDLCDDNNVDDLPHVQILIGKEVKWEYAGDVDYSTIDIAMSTL